MDTPALTKEYLFLRRDQQEDRRYAICDRVHLQPLLAILASARPIIDRDTLGGRPLQAGRGCHDFPAFLDLRTGTTHSRVV